MIITEKIIFIHVPKTAGQSIAGTLWDELGLSGRKHLMNSINGRRLENPHISAYEVFKQIGLTKWQKAFKFTVVRHPFDRLVSFYHYGIRKLEKDIFHSFEDFCLFVIGDVKKPNAGMGWNNAKRLQSDYVNMALNYVMKFEDLPTCWEKFRYLTGIKSDLPHLNKSNHDVWQKYLNGMMARRMREHFKKDFEKFGYE